MKKIMFNDKYGLTAAVLAGTKTQTRRIINVMPKEPDILYSYGFDKIDAQLLDNYIVVTTVAESRYNVGEVIAVAQSYFDIKTSANSYRPSIYREWHKYLDSLPIDKGYYNKMFVRADLMPHKIKITDIRVQRLQDISDDDCLAEGIISINSEYTFVKKGKNPKFDTPRKAYASLADKIYGKGTWERNPYVFAYNFKLIK